MPGAGVSGRLTKGGAARGMLRVMGINAIFLGLMWAYWGSIKKSRKWLHLRWPHLTAARFDLMYVLRKNEALPVFQKDLREALDVCRPVLTRMLKSLVELGWVTRTRSSMGDAHAIFDRSMHLRDLPHQEGRRAHRSAHRRLVRSGRAMRWANRALAGKYGSREKWCAFRRMEWFEDILANVHHVFKVGGWLGYPWHPDD